MKQKIQFLIVSMLFLLATPTALTAYGQPVLTFAAQNGTITAKAGGATITSGATVASAHLALLRGLEHRISPHNLRISLATLACVER